MTIVNVVPHVKKKRQLVRGVSEPPQYTVGPTDEFTGKRGHQRLGDKQYLNV